MSDDKEARIAELAHQIWLAEGRPEGQDEEHWYRARAVIEAEDRAAQVRNGKLGRHAKPKAGLGRSMTGLKERTAARGAASEMERPVLAEVWPPRHDDLVQIRKHFGTLKANAARDLDQIIGKLAQFYSAKKIETWLVASHPMLKGERAIDLVRAGRGEEVLSVIRGLEDGIYT